jgi:hypothetical protein
MFLNATMLAGVAAAVLPLVVHMLNRARYRNVEWGAMMFLEPASGQLSGDSRLREISLLLLRMAMVALLAVALARPVLMPASGGLQDEPACMVIILDRSVSMELIDNGPPRLEAARRAALGALSSLRPGDEAAVIITPDAFGQPQSATLTSDLQYLSARIGNTQTSAGLADMAAAMEVAADLLSQSRATHRQVVVISDRQAANWRGLDAEFAATWKASFRDDGGEPPQLSWIPVGDADAGNVGIASVQILNTPVIRGLPAEVEVRVQNYDTVPYVSLPLTLSTDAGTLYTTRLNLPAGDAVTARCNVTFAETGSALMTARIGAAGLSWDDTMDTSVDVRDPIDVLLIRGDERDQAAAPLAGEADFPRLALAPFASADETGNDPARVQVASADAWPEINGTQQRVVILDNVARFTPRQVRQLEQFVYGGGGLLMAPGNLSRVEDYNRQLWRNGAGILPAELEPPTAADGAGATSLSGLELSHPVFGFLRGREDPLPRFTVGRSVPARASGSQARVLGRYESGQPFLIEGAYGRGRVMLMTTSLGAEWNTLPLSNFYLPMLQSAARYLAGGVQPRRNVAPGDPLVADIVEAAEPQVLVAIPGVLGESRADLLRTSSGFEARFSNTARPGNYIMDVRGERGRRRIYFVVRGPRDESDVRSLSPAQFTSLHRDFGFERLDPDPQTITAAIGESRLRRELWPYLLVAVIAAAALEVMLARFWTAGRSGEAE